MSMVSVSRLLRFSKIGIDLALLATVFGLTFALRFEADVPAEYLAALVITLPVVLAVKFTWLLALKIPRLPWRYVSIGEARKLFTALGAACLTLIAWRLLVGSFDALPFLPNHVPLPLGVLLIDLFLSFLALVGIRVVYRLWVEHDDCPVPAGEAPVKIPTLLIGAGRVGVLVSREIATRPDNAIAMLGFLDDDLSKAGGVIQGLPVLGTTEQLAEVAQRHGAQQVLITLVDTTGATVRRLAKLCEACGLPAKIIPEIHDIVEGKVNLSRLRDVSIEEILNRDPVLLDTGAISGIVRGQTVLITGAGGSIGSELCRIVGDFQPQTLVLVEKTENSLFHIHRQLTERFPDLNVVPCLADIRDRPRMKELFALHRPGMLLHAAAHKHVPLMEAHPEEAIKNNVLGTRTLADLADEYRVGVFVMISTDKAVRPTSVMGVSKRIAELYIQALSQRSATRFVAVRFGNVLGSAGSVVPIFKEQIAHGGPVTVTHPEMTRYFMTIPEACQLVLQAASMGTGGEIFILDMGEPVKIVDLARDLIRLSGYQPDRDIEIRFTGIRPGEKLFEELALQEECADKTQHPRIFIGRLQARPWEVIHREVRELGELARTGNRRLLLEEFQAIVPEYQPNVPARVAAVKAVRADGGHEPAGQRGPLLGAPA